MDKCPIFPVSRPKSVGRRRAKLLQSVKSLLRGSETVFWEGIPKETCSSHQWEICFCLIFGSSSSPAGNGESYLCISQLKTMGLELWSLLGFHHGWAFGCVDYSMGQNGETIQVDSICLFWNPKHCVSPNHLLSRLPPAFAVLFPKPSLIQSFGKDYRWKASACWVGGKVPIFRGPIHVSSIFLDSPPTNNQDPHIPTEGFFVSNCYNTISYWV